MPLTAVKTPAPLPLNDMANALRFLAVDGVDAANSGHPGAPMGLAGVMAVLFSRHLNFNPDAPAWPGRDRFILSNGHASMLLYATLHLTGYAISLDDLKNFRQLHSKTPGHPEHSETPGVETTTGPLGQGFANAVGMAIAQRIQAARFGQALFNHKTYVMVGDGCLMEGLSHEAAELAVAQKLNNLIVLFDDNGISIDGPTTLAVAGDQLERFKAYGFATRRVDGHDHDAVDAALTWAATVKDRPVFIACKTTIGYGSPKVAGTSKAHGSPLGAAESAAARKALGWKYGPFEVPASVTAAWAQAAEHGKRNYATWQKAFAQLDLESRSALDAALQGDVPLPAVQALEALAAKAVAEKPSVATRKASGNCLDALAPYLPGLISGSADLTPSNNTQPAGATSLTVENPGGHYIHYGVREHAMAAVMNGLALYGGIIPVGGTFLCFLDYLRPGLRLSALMGLRVIYILTHDSIGLGEDGPTHQPVEHMAMLRATPNVLAFRPADQVEAAECWAIALASTGSPSVMALSRQNLPTVRKTAGDQLSARGGYILADSEKPVPDGIFIATGSEVHLALAARDMLLEQGVDTRVVSMPCTTLFDQQDATYRESVLPATVTARVGIEAAAALGWAKYLGANGQFIGMTGFGASAPAEQLYEHFGITPKAAADAMRSQVNS